MSLVALIDADLLGRKRHRFPNLALMKISAFERSQGNTPVLLLDYAEFTDEYDHGWLAKVFTATPVPDDIVSLEDIVCGGTGFFYDKAPALPDEIEHMMPDYSLYDRFVTAALSDGAKPLDLKYYTDYSIGFLTRGCFRQCEFCVNRNATKSSAHSPLSEFFDPTRPKLCFLDDNFFACGHWRSIADTIESSGRMFQFKQGLDERILTDEKIKFLMEGKTDGDLIFAFDDIADRPIIETKLARLREMYPEKRKTLKFYVFCGFDRNDQWDAAFWSQDIFDIFERARILMQYGAIPYIMRFERYEESPHRGMYVTLARWANQPSFFKKKSFREFAEANGATSAALRYATEFETAYPEIAPYYDMRFDQKGQ